MFPYYTVDIIIFFFSFYRLYFYKKIIEFVNEHNQFQLN